MCKNALLKVKMTRPGRPSYHAYGSTDSIDYFLDGDGEPLVEERYNQETDMHIILVKKDGDWKSLILYVEGPNFPGDFYLFSSGKAPQYITTARPNIPPENIHPIASLTFAARDGLKIPVILTIPKDEIDNIKNLPAVILPHGGPESYDRLAFDWMSQAMANNGYVVVQPQFRGSTSFGLEFRNAGRGEWGRKMQDDLTDSLKFMVDKGFVDPKRVCIVGLSYGGYAALAGGAFTPELYSCVVSINGVSDVNSMVDTEEYYFGSNHWVVSYWQELLANGEVDKKRLKQISPVNFAAQFQAPTLLISSENDENVKPQQSEDMYDELRSNDKIAKLVELKDENHYLETNRGRLEALQEVMKFLNSHLDSKD